MFRLLKSDRRYALCLAETEALLATAPMKKGRDNIDIVARQQKKDDSPFDLIALFAGTGRIKARSALVLPLNEFELVSITVPLMSREAVAKTLPYSLSKVLSRPVSDFIYDWQVAQQFKDRQELTVFLYLLQGFQQYRQELLVHQKEIAWFEPDVFAACSYLQSCRETTDDSAFLVLLAWQNSISIAVYDNQRISLVRGVELLMPAGRPDGSAEHKEKKDLSPGDHNPEPAAAAAPAVEAEKFLEGDSEARLEGDRGDHIERVAGFALTSIDNRAIDVDSEAFDFLAGFGVQTDETLSGETTDIHDFPIEKQVSMRPETDPWTEYIENLYLEIMRTGNYHTSVIKGKAIRQVFVGGAEHFYDEMVKSGQFDQNLQLRPFPPEKTDADCSPTLAAICLGALQR